MRTRAHGHGIARYTWIIDFVHERATTGASKIPVALLIVVNYLLYTASFQMRFRRFPRADKSNCDLSRYRCVSCRQSYHSNRTFTRCSEFLNMRSVRTLRTVLLLTSSLPSSSFCTLSLLFAILLYLSLTSSPLFLSLSRFLFPFRSFSLLSRFFSPFLPLFHPARLFASYYYCFLPRILFFALACFILVMLLIMLLSLSTCCHMRTCILSLYRLFFPPSPNSIIFFIFSQIRSFSFPPLSLSFSVFFLLLSLRESSHFLTAEQFAANGKSKRRKRGEDSEPENQAREFRFSRGQRTEFSSGLLSL